MAQHLDVSPRTYGYWERNERTPDALALERLVMDGWNINWLLTGTGAERLDQLQEPRADYRSQDVSGADLMIAVELVEERLRRNGEWLPKPRFFDLVAEVYAAISRGIPYAEILGFEPSARDFDKAERSNDDGGQGVAQQDPRDPGRGAAGAAKRRG